MAICKLDDNWLRNTSCGYNLGSIVMIYAINTQDLVSTTIEDNDGQELTGFTLAAGANVYQLEPARNSASWSDTLVVNDDGSKYRTHLVAFNLLGKYNKEQADIVDAISLGKYAVIVQKSDGGYVMLGRLNGLESTVATIGGSEDNSVPNGLQVSMEANQAEVALPLSDEAITYLNTKKKNLTEYTTLDTPVTAGLFQFVYGDTPRGNVEISIYDTTDASLTASWTWDSTNHVWAPSVNNTINATATDKLNYIEVILDEPMENIAVGQSIEIEEMYYA